MVAVMEGAVTDESYTTRTLISTLVEELVASKVTEVTEEGRAISAEESCK